MSVADIYPSLTQKPDGFILSALENAVPRAALKTVDGTDPGRRGTLAKPNTSPGRCPLLADFVAEVGHFGCELPASVFLKRLLIALL
jgi:hypothetical protein